MQQNWGAFDGKVVAEWKTHPGDDRAMQLVETFKYVDPSGKEWTAEGGYDIDGASIPRIVWTVVGSPYVGDYRRAAALHDAGYVKKLATKAETDLMFYYAMRCDGTHWFKAKVFYAAVVLFGGPPWDTKGANQMAVTRDMERDFEELQKWILDQGEAATIAALDTRLKEIQDKHGIM